MHFEKTLSSNLEYKGKIIDIYHDMVELENGKTALREVIRHNGAVAVLARDGDELLFVRQYRYAVGRELLEICAGKLEKGEEPRAAALRELQEETGMECQKLELLGVYHASPGVYDEEISLFYATDLIYRGAHPDDDEFVTTVRMKPQAFETLIAENAITDGKTLAAYALAKTKKIL